MKDVSLYLQEGSMDKIYRAWIEPSGSGFIVQAAWGRRGGTQQVGKKTISPVSLGEAEAIWTKLVAEKVGKGYHQGEDAPPVALSKAAPEKHASFIRPMLLNQIDEAAAMKLMKDDRFVAQAKSDGVRCQAHRDGDSVIAFSRTGKELALPVEVTQAALALDLRAFILDGELVDGRLIAFDVLSTGADRRKLPYDGRLELLQSFVPDAIGPLFYTPTAWVEFEKKTMLKSLRSTGAEGMVFKNRKAAYSSDRPSSGGNALKWKWKSTATLRIVSVGANGKNSCEVALEDGTVVASVSLIGRPVVAPGMLASIEYLYAHRNGGLTQPVFKCIREDVEADSAADLQYKGEAA